MENAILYISIQAGFAGLLLWVVKMWVGSINDSIKEIKKDLYELNLAITRNEAETRSDIAGLKKDMERLEYYEKRFWAKKNMIET